MDLHANAKLGLAGRRELVLAIEHGLSLKAAATAFSVSPATAHRWWHRWLEGGRAVSALLDRSSRPRSQPRRLTAAEEEPILRARRETNLGPGRLAGSSAAPARRSGRCSAGTDSPVGRADSGRATAATSGHVRERCCTWT